VKNSERVKSGIIWWIFNIFLFWKNVILKLAKKNAFASSLVIIDQKQAFIAYRKMPKMTILTPSQKARFWSVRSAFFLEWRSIEGSLNYVVFLFFHYFKLLFFLILYKKSILKKLRLIQEKCLFFSIFFSIIYGSFGNF